MHVGQKVHLSYEGRDRVFRVLHVLDMRNGDDENNLSSKLGSMNIGSQRNIPLWIATWDTTVHVVSNAESQDESGIGQASLP